MAAVVGKAPGFNLSKSIGAHAQDKTEAPKEFSRLPGGISGGVAELNAARIQLYKSGPNKGQKQLYLEGRVITPKSVLVTKKYYDNVSKKIKVVPPFTQNVEGSMTQQILPLCQTTNSKKVVTSADDNTATALNTLRLIAGDECMAEVNDEETLTALLDQLAEQRVQFKLTTRWGTASADYPEPMVFEVWDRLESEAVVPEANGEVVEEPTAEAGEEASPPATEEFDETTSDLDGLGALAMSEDDGAADAAEKLQEMALAAGIEKEWIEAPDTTWADVAERLKTGGEAPAEEETKEWVPDKGECIKYRPLDPKTKKPAINPKTKKPLIVDVEIIAVDKKAKTVDLKNVATKMLYKKVAWKSLEQS